MYRIIRIMPDGGYTILTRSMHMNGWCKEPVFTANAADSRIKEYGTKYGAMKAMTKLRMDKYDVLVIDSAEGVEIPESDHVRMVKKNDSD